MRSEKTTPADYIKSLPDDRKRIMNKLRKIIKTNLPKGFVEQMSYGMLGYVVPLSRYPDGYLNKKNEPLPFITIASQKNFIALYHMGLYSNPPLLTWFKQEYALTSKMKLDMGKSCIRFKNTEHIPFELVGVLAGKISVDNWIQTYKKERSKRLKKAVV